MAVATDRRIDRLVHELYELTDEEIRIVEEATQRIGTVPIPIGIRKRPQHIRE